MNKTKFKQTEIGMIPEDWEVKEFQNVAELKHGYQFRNYDFTDEGIKVFKITQIKGNKTMDISSCSYIDKERLPNFERFIIKKGDILMALTGATIGKIVKFNCNETILQNYRVGNFIPKKSLDKDFLYQFLSSKFFFNQILSRQTQSAQQNIGKNEINKMLIIYPPIPEQLAIAKILSDLDSKIELLQKQNETLEKIGQAIFKQWFVDFEFPNEEGKPYKSSGGKMVESELGEIPEGWEIKKLKDIVNQLKPGTNYQPKRVQSGIPFVNVRNIKNGFLDLSDVKYITDDEFLRVHKSWRPEEHDVLITRIGTLGNVAVIRKKDLPIAVHYNSIDLKEKKPYSFQFIYFLLKSKSFQEKYHLKKKQSVQEYVTIDEVENLDLILPKDQDKVIILLQIFNSLFNKLEINQNKIESLQKTRDLLLPKLMTGKIRVPLGDKR